MNPKLLKAFLAPTAEEKIILETQRGIDKSLYTGTRDFVVHGTKLLGNKRMDIRPHTRYTEFPLHGHDFFEMMYVANGTITHTINGQTVTLEKGDILLLNRHIQHAVATANTEDIGINFILSDAFLCSVWHMLFNCDTLARFLAENFKPDGNGEFLHFRTGHILPISNLLENVVCDLLAEKQDNFILTQTVSLLFQYLSRHPETLVHMLCFGTKSDRLKSTVLSYIAANYTTANLSELAQTTGYADEYLCRVIKKLFGTTFKQLVLDYRMYVAEKLFLTTDRSIENIISEVGYDNKSYFHRRFKEKHGMTPYRWRTALHETET